MKAYFEHQQRVFDEEATQLGDVLVMLADFDQEGFDVSHFWMSRLARPSGSGGFREGGIPIEEGKKGAITHHNGIIGTKQIHGLLVKNYGRMGHEKRLLSERILVFFYSARERPFCQEGKPLHFLMEWWRNTGSLSLIQ